MPPKSSIWVDACPDTPEGREDPRGTAAGTRAASALTDGRAASAKIQPLSAAVPGQWPVISIASHEVRVRIRQNGTLDIAQFPGPARVCRANEITIARHQQIRDPRWVLEDKYGTCLDIAVAYAAMCEEAHVRCLLAVTDTHAFVVVAPGWLHPPHGPHRPLDLSSLGGEARPGQEGVAWFRPDSQLVDEIDTGKLIAVDCFRVTDANFDFGGAVGLGRDWIVRHGLRLVDVAWLHQSLQPPLDPPTSRPAISFYVPGPEGKFDEYASHKALLAELEAQSGTVVLIGRSGAGKSTLARQVALKAKAGAGWFLNASDREALVNSLAEAELRERNRQEPVCPPPIAPGMPARLSAGSPIQARATSSCSITPTAIQPS